LFSAPNISSQYKYVNGALLLLLIMAVCAPLFFLTPEINGNFCLLKINPLECSVKKNTGKECTSCGLTRSILALYSGDVERSYKYHSAGVFFISCLFFELGFRMVPLLCRQRIVPWIDLIQILIVICSLGFAINHH